MKTITIRFRDCACPGTPHTDGDEVYAPAKMPAIPAIEAQVRIRWAADNAAQTSFWVMACLEQVTGWNCTDAGGHPIPFDLNVLLDDFELAEPVIDALDDQYKPQVIHPLAKAPSKPSPSGETPSEGKVVPMSRTTRSTSKQPKRSSRRASEGSMRSTA